MLMHQVRLRQLNGTEMVVWVEADLRLRPGHEVVGKDGDRWRVTQSYRTGTISTTEINRGWTVGGLA